MVLNWGDEQRNREARTGVSTSRKSQMMKSDKLSLYEPELDIVAYDEEADRTVTIAIMCDDLTERERKFYAELIVKAVNSYEFS